MPTLFITFLKISQKLKVTGSNIKVRKWWTNVYIKCSSNENHWGSIRENQWWEGGGERGWICLKSGYELKVIKK